jgi:urea carboxylase
MTARYSWGADEHLFVEVAEEMSLEAYFRAMAIVTALRERRPDGVLDVCPANASYQVRFDPDQLAPDDLLALVQGIEGEVGDAHGFELETRIVEIPVLYGDPWTHETLMRFRDRHQTPDRTDIEFAAELNGYDTVDAFIAAICRAPFIVSMTGFVPDLPWDYQLVPEDRQIEVPKYVRPRTDTPDLAFGWGGAFAAIYPVRGAGGYQLLGRCPVPIIDPAQRLPDFRENPFLCLAGDLHSYRAIDRAEYDAIREQVDAGTYAYDIRPVEFVPQDFYDDPDGTAQRLLGVLHGT